MKKSGKFGFALIWLFTRPFAVLPIGFHRANGRFIGWLVGNVFKYRRSVVLINLSRSFPEKKYEELNEICDKFYQHLCTLFCEAIWFGASSSHKRLRKVKPVRIVNPEIANRYLDKGKSIIVLASHCGNWEFTGGFATYTEPDNPLRIDSNNYNVIYKRQSSAAWDRFMYWNRLRPKHKKDYDGLVESNEILRYAYKHREEARMYIFITDQSPYGESARINVGEFMHQETYSMVGAAAFAKMFSLPVIYQKMNLDKNGNYEIKYKEITEDAAESEIFDIMRKYYDYLQEDLEEQPFNYLWSHKRWKEITVNQEQQQ